MTSILRDLRLCRTPAFRIVQTKSCPDAPDDGGRCDHCPLDRLDAAQCAEKGLLIRRALDLMSALKLAVHIGLDLVLLQVSPGLLESPTVCVKSHEDDVLPDGDSFKVTLRVLGATTVHLLKMPSAKDVFEYRPHPLQRGFARLLDMPFGRKEVTINIASAAALYKKLVTSTQGYVGEAPIIHQAVALKAAIDAMETAFAEDHDANF
jgi:hypothetical protein